MYDDVFADLSDQSFTSTDYEAQWAGEYNYQSCITFSYTQTNPYSHVSQNIIRKFYHDYISSTPSVVLLETKYDNNNQQSLLYSFYAVDSNGKIKSNNRGGALESWVDGVYSTGTFSGSQNIRIGDSTQTNLLTSFSGNIPLFDSYDDAIAYLKGQLDYTDALNYTKIYREADWLSDNWVGTLTDPLTGLNALGDFVNIARHQGLNALGNELTPDDFTDYLRDYFANAGTGLDTYPNFNPALDPIVYDPTGTMPDFTLDPARNPVIQPSTSSGTDPSPGVDPSPGPGVNPGTEIDLDEELPSMPSALLPLAGELKHKFPFSIPWDLQYLLEQLSGSSASSAYSVTYYDDGDHGGGGASRPGETQAPRWVIPVVVGSAGIHEELVIDLKDFQAVSDISRTLLSVLFCVCLMKFTIKIVEMRKEE